MMKQDSDVVIWKKKSPWNARKLLASLRRDLKGRAKTAYLFGSHSTGSATSNSDVDLFIVAQTNKPWASRGKDYLDLFDRYGAVDLVVYTPDEWESLRKQPTAFLQHAKKSWKKIL